MKTTRIFAAAIAMSMTLLLSACAGTPAQSATSAPSAPPAQSEATAPPEQPAGQIYLYGERHGEEKILEKEFELWQGYYEKEGLRHLFVEYSYFTAEFLNLWMQADNDEILDAIYDDWQGTASQVPSVKAFLQKIKSQCPETIFHGTDVGHQYESTGARFLELAKHKSSMEAAEQIKLVEKSIEQGKRYYENQDAAYRENMMAENFVWEFDRLEGESVMGIYGTAHIGFDTMDFVTQTVPSMANQLKKLYGDNIHAEDLSGILLDPIRVDKISVSGKEYDASYFGSENLSGIVEGYASREFWRLENAYDDLRDKPKTGDVLPFDNYPTPLEKGQVFVIDYTKTDGSVEREFFRADGEIWNGRPTTEAFTAE